MYEMLPADVCILIISKDSRPCQLYSCCLKPNSSVVGLLYGKCFCIFLLNRAHLLLLMCPSFHFHSLSFSIWLRYCAVLSKITIFLNIPIILISVKIEYQQ
uniref:Uncharacterized protein n=1 Tax=Cacopsylla melanoneura TaxID=428564 RepID=A0A8D9E5Q3_9HEMI